MGIFMVKHQICKIQCFFMWSAVIVIHIICVMFVILHGALYGFYQWNVQVLSIQFEMAVGYHKHNEIQNMGCSEGIGLLDTRSLRFHRHIAMDLV